MWDARPRADSNSLVISFDNVIEIIYLTVG